MRITAGGRSWPLGVARSAPFIIPMLRKEDRRPELANGTKSRGVGGGFKQH